MKKLLFIIGLYLPLLCFGQEETLPFSVGLSVSPTISYGQTVQPLNVDAKTEPEPGYILGAVAEYNFPSGRFSLRSGILYNRLRTKQQIIRKHTSWREPSETDDRLIVRAIGLPLSLKYRFVKSRLINMYVVPSIALYFMYRNTSSSTYMVTELVERVEEIDFTPFYRQLSSASLGVGAEIRTGKKTHFFFEPSASVYHAREPIYDIVGFTLFSGLKCDL